MKMATFTLTTLATLKIATFFTLTNSSQVLSIGHPLQLQVGLNRNYYEKRHKYIISALSKIYIISAFYRQIYIITALFQLQVHPDMATAKNLHRFSHQLSVLFYFLPQSSWLNLAPYHLVVKLSVGIIAN